MNILARVEARFKASSFYPSKRYERIENQKSTFNRNGIFHTASRIVVQKAVKITLFLYESKLKLTFPCEKYETKMVPLRLELRTFALLARRSTD